MAKTLVIPPPTDLSVEQNGVHKPEPMMEAALIPTLASAAPSPEPTPESLLSERSICLALSLRKPGNHRKLSASLVEVDADKDLISAQKTLLSSEHLKTIDHYDGEIRRFMYNTCLPSLFKDGIYLVPIALIEEVEAKLTAFDDKRKQLVAAFLDAYPDL